MKVLILRVVVLSLFAGCGLVACVAPHVTKIAATSDSKDPKDAKDSKSAPEAIGAYHPSGPYYATPIAAPGSRENAATFEEIRRIKRERERERELRAKQQ